MSIFRNKLPSKGDFLLYVPVKSHQNWIQKGNVIYLVFKYDKPMERLAAWLTNKPTIRDIRLDGLGTKVWQLMDGKNNVYKIGQLLKKEVGLDCEPVYERLIMYLRYLNRRGWIKFKLSGDSKDAFIN